MTDRLIHYLRRLPEDERQRLYLDRYNEAASAGEMFGVTPEDVKQACRNIEKAGTATGFARLKEWHDAVLIDQRLSAVEKVASLRIWSFVSHKHYYAWPSQDRLASELGYSRGPNLGKALKRTFEIGALSPVKVKDLPEDIRFQAVKGSKRSLRGIAYRLNAVSRWQSEAAEFATQQNGRMFRGGTFEGSVKHHLNSEGNYLSASPSHSPHAGDSSSASRLVDSPQYGNDTGGQTYG